MDSLFGGSAIRTLRKMIRKGLIKEQDLDTPPDGWFIAMGYERELGTGKWIRIKRTFRGALPSLPIHKIPKYKNVLTGKTTFDPVMHEKQY
tara:strand:+ start:133 stop:405 length:273 start_codon:yes stop_codon:yes gene_type:complete